MKKLGMAMSVFQEDISESGKNINIKAGDISIHVEPGDEFEAVVKKYAYWNN